MRAIRKRVSAGLVAAVALAALITGTVGTGATASGVTGSSLALRTAQLLGVSCTLSSTYSGLTTFGRETIVSALTCDHGRISSYVLNPGYNGANYVTAHTEPIKILEYITGRNWYVVIDDHSLSMASIDRVSPARIAQVLGGRVLPPLNNVAVPARPCNGWHTCSALSRPPYAPTPPSVGETWHTAISFDVCGVVEPALRSDATTTSAGLFTTGGGVMVIAPKTAKESGRNATLGRFAAEYPGLGLTNSSVHYPGGTAYRNGQKCASGTPDAGQSGVVRVRTWNLPRNFGSTAGIVRLLGGGSSRSPADLKLQNGQLITVGFGPSSAALANVPSATVILLLRTLEGTTAPVTTTAPVPGSG